MNMYIVTGGWHKVWAVIAEDEAQCLDMIIKATADWHKPDAYHTELAKEDMEKLEAFSLVGEHSPRIVLNLNEA